MAGAGRVLGRPAGIPGGDMPLAAAALLFAGGIALGRQLPFLRPGAAWVAAVFCWVLGCLAGRPGAWVLGPRRLGGAAGSQPGLGRARRLGALLCLALGLVWAGAAHLAAARAADENRPEQLFAGDEAGALAGPAGGAGAAAGYICSPPEATAGGWRLILCPVAGVDGGRPPRIRLEWPSREAGDEPPARYGDAVIVRGAVVRPRPPANPWGFDGHRYWEARRVPYVLYINDPGQLLQAGTPPGGMRRLLFDLRQEAYNRLRRQMTGGQWGLAAALLFGDQGELDPDDRAGFQATGLAHLLAVSGLHVGLVVGCLNFLLRPVVAHRHRRFMVQAVVLAALVLWTGGRAPIVRAVLMLALAGCQRLLDRPPAPLNAVGAAALALLIYHPYQLWDVGWQLSFGAAAAIALLAGGFTTGGPSSSSLVPRLTGPLAAGLAAFLGTLPVMLHAFGTVQPLSILLTPPAVPLVAAVLVLGLVLLPAVALFPAAGGVSAVIISGPVRLLQGLVHWAEHLPLPPVVLPVPPPWLTACYYAWLGWCLADFRPPLVKKRRPRLPRPGRLAAAVLGLAALLVWNSVLAAPRRLEMVFPDVGQGDGFVIGIPPGLWVVVDGGARDQARFVLAPYLRRRGVQAPDLLVATHGDADHAAGIAHLMAAGPGLPGALVEPGFPAGGAYDAMVAAARERGVPRVVPRPGDQIPLGPAFLEVLGPPRPPLAGTGSDVNNNSLVMILHYGAFRGLLPGDLEAPGEEFLLSRHREAGLRAHLLKVGHHGSRTSTTPAFLEAIDPEVAVIQAGRNNRYGFPHPEVTARLAARGTLVLSTPQHGALRFTVEKGRWCYRAAWGGGGCRPVE